jgi:hypothetical protein
LGIGGEMTIFEDRLKRIQDDIAIIRALIQTTKGKKSQERTHPKSQNLGRTRKTLSGDDRKGEEMKAFITKYALTAGIIETDQAKKYDNESIIAHIGLPSYFFCGTQWQHTREQAITRANIMRDQRIQALEKQIEKLKGLVFK